jgi:hypothetical protein
MNQEELTPYICSSPVNASPISSLRHESQVWSGGNNHEIEGLQNDGTDGIIESLYNYKIHVI